MRIIFKFASRSRPEKLFACLDNIIEMAQSIDYVIVPTLDDNDYTIDAKFRARLNTYGANIQPVFGRSMSKINAINRDMPTGAWDIVIATSDDMMFNVPGFDLQIIRHMQQYFPDTDGVLHYPDGFAHGDILSLPVMGRAYYNRFNYIYAPQYVSLFCDEEALIVAQHLGKLASIDYHFYKHNHPSWGAGKMDAQYKHTESFHAVDKRTFETRKRRNFYL